LQFPGLLGCFVPASQDASCQEIANEVTNNTLIGLQSSKVQADMMTAFMNGFICPTRGLGMAATAVGHHDKPVSLSDFDPCTSNLDAMAFFSTSIFKGP
jgi:hypothetical protein